jgi:hypothetical protein
MRFWWREVAGWLLVLLGLFMFYLCYAHLMGEQHAILEAPTLAFIGFVLFRGGIHLLKLAVAARIATQTQEQVAGTRPGAARPTPLAPQRPAPARRS